MTYLINYNEKAIIDSETGDLVRPSCFNILVQYTSYLECRNRVDEVNTILEQVFKGEKVISMMTDKMQNFDID